MFRPRCQTLRSDEQIMLLKRPHYEMRVFNHAVEYVDSSCKRGTLGTTPHTTWKHYWDDRCFTSGESSIYHGIVYLHGKQEEEPRLRMRKPLWMTKRRPQYMEG